MRDSEKFEIELNKKRKEFGKSLVFSILSILLFYNILGLLLEHFAPSYRLANSPKLFLFCFIAIAYVAFLISKTKYNFLTLYKIITGSLFLLVFYFSLNICHKTPIIYFFYIPTLLMLLIVSDIKTTAFGTILIIILCAFTPHIAQLLNISNPTKPPIDHFGILKTLGYMIIIFSAYLSLLLLYYYNEFIKIELKYPLRNTKFDETSCSIEDLSNRMNKTNDTDYEKFENIYIQIIKYFETEKPFQDAVFNKRSLAQVLQTNETYISIALNQIGNINFNSLVNKYRVNQVIEELNMKNYKKYTIEHIYIKAGFTQQSTFNRVFKEFTGTTPSEYIDKLES